MLDFLNTIWYLLVEKASILFRYKLLCQKQYKIFHHKKSYFLCL